MRRTLGTITVLCLFFNSPIAAAGNSAGWVWGDSDSAQTFYESMTNDTSGILLSNFPLYFWTIKFEDNNAFADLANNKYRFRAFIGARIAEICLRSGEMDPSRCYSAKFFLQNRSWVEGEGESGHIAGYRLALVFFRVDEDNWFSFDSVSNKTQAYLNDYSYLRDRLELRLLKGFHHTGVLVRGGIDIQDLPVVIDYEEKTFTIWSAQLFD